MFMKQRNYKISEMRPAAEFLYDPCFTTGVYEYVNRMPFREFKNKNEQFLYERGRQFAAYLTHLGYDKDLIKNHLDWLGKELIMAVKTNVLI